MNIAIVGAGIIGITTAYELALDGHEVTILEQHGAAAEASSFAHAGRISVADVAPWTTRIRLGWPPSSRDLAWLWRWRRQARRPAQPVAPLRPLLHHSRKRLHEISTELQLDYERSDGALTLLRSEKDMALAQPGLQLLRDMGQNFREISADEARRIEPALHPDVPLAGAVHWPDDEVGNCRLYAQQIKQAAQARGATFEFQTQVTAVGPRTVTIAGEEAPRRYDAVVLCAGMASAALLEPLGLPQPLMAVHGCSISAPVREPLNAPRGAVLDAHHEVNMSRLGQRVRVTGGAVLGRAPSGHADLNLLYRVLSDWFPGGAQLTSGVQVWRGVRAMTADGLPLLGATGVPGLWLNMGHGASGWALASGSARALAALLGGHDPDFDLAPFSIERLRRHG